MRRRSTLLVCAVVAAVVAWAGWPNAVRPAASGGSGATGRPVPTVGGLVPAEPTHLAALGDDARAPVAGRPVDGRPGLFDAGVAPPGPPATSGADGRFAVAPSLQRAHGDADRPTMGGERAPPRWRVLPLGS